MPDFPLVRGLAESYVKNGIDASEAKALFDYVCTEVAPTTTRAKEHFAGISELFHTFFTDSGADRWAELTGIRASKTAVKYPKGYPSVLALRAKLQAEAAAIAARYTVERAKNGKVAVRADTASGTFEIERRQGGEPKPASLDFAAAHAMTLPPALIRRGLEQDDSRAVARVFSALRDLDHDNDGSLAPRDLQRQPRWLTDVMTAVYARTGEKKLTLSAIAKELPAAIDAVLQGGRGKTNRQDEELRPLFVASVEDGVDFMARGFQREVIERGRSFTRFLEQNGINGAANKKSMVDQLTALVPPPTLDQIANLYARAVSGQLLVREFYNAARLEQRDLFTLQAAYPDLFPRPKGLKGSAALAAPKRDGTDAQLDDLADAWQKEVVEGGVGVEQFARDHDVRLSVLQRLRNAHPTLFELPAKATGGSSVEQRAIEVSAALAAAQTRDPFAKVPKLLAEIGVSYTQYYALRRAHPDRFARVDSKETWQQPVADEVVRLMREHPTLSRNELVAKLQKRWPEMTYSRLAHLKEAKPDLPIPGRYERRQKWEIDALAQALLVVLKKDPKTTAAKLAKAVQKDFPGVDEVYVRSVMRDFRPTLFAAHRVGKDRTKEQRSLAPAMWLDLLIRTSPPGTRLDTLSERYEALLAAKGIPRGKRSRGFIQDLALLKQKLGRPTPLDHQAAVAAEIIDEYARGAKKGTPPNKVYEAVIADYPVIERMYLRYQAVWAKTKTKVDLTSRGEKAPVRYRGGWDLRRVLENAPKEEKAELARLSESLHIPVTLKELDLLLEDVGDAQPLRNFNFLWITHLLADVVPLGFALRKLGAGPDRSMVVSSPYGNNATVKGCLEDMGFQTRVPKLSVADYRKTVTDALDQMIAKAKKNDAPIAVMDDGGLVADILHSDPKYAPFIPRIRIVEQTTGGVLLAEKHALKTLIVNVARSKSKAEEGEVIGDVVAAKIAQAVSRGSGSLQGKKAVLVGYGIIGPSIAANLEALGMTVTVIDRNKARIAAAEEDFATVLDDPNDPKSQAARKKAIAGADLVIGATGRPSITLDDFRAMKDGARFASASSKRYEGDMESLEKAATKIAEVPADSPLITLPTKAYTLAGKQITVIGDGWPANFDGGVQSCPPDLVQLTDVAMLGALLQATAGAGQVGLRDLDAESDERMLSRHAAAKAGEYAVYDPGAWIDHIVQLAGQR